MGKFMKNGSSGKCMQQLQLMWKKAAVQLAIELVAPFEFNISDTFSLHACFLVKDFGAENGMLVFNSYLEIKPYLGEIKQAGYGFSIMADPEQENEFASGDYMEVLGDWGWTGKPESKPSWL
ncbi:MAG TPA: hypothetical protein VN030_11660 [Cellvibrio sp.]|nr:hypothetical protein [Cellvibrio sp.]